MAVVRPFRAVTFSLDAGSDVTAHVAPPYDVVTPEQRTSLLAGEPHNVIAVDLPAGDAGRYERAAETWREWLSSGVLVEADCEAFYILEQAFTFRHRDLRRRALIAAVDLEPFDAGVVLPHERTLPKALNDRIELLRATEANLSQVFGLFSGGDTGAPGLLDTSDLGDPIATAMGPDGVVSRLWAVTDPARIGAISAALADARIFIADGHHRYTTALAYRDERHEAEHPQGRVPYDATMMALVDMDDDELVVLPTHRLADAEGVFDSDAFLSGLGELFELTPSPDDPLLALRDLDEPPTFVVALADGRRLVARMKDGASPATAIPGDAADAWKELDVTVLQELVLGPLLGIRPDQPRTLERLSFVKGAEDALASSAEHDVTFILRPTRMDQLRAVSLAGELMPQKSTYFFPKLLSGLVMRDLRD